MNLLAYELQPNETPYKASSPSNETIMRKFNAEFDFIPSTDHALDQLLKTVPKIFQGKPEIKGIIDNLRGKLADLAAKLDDLLIDVDNAAKLCTDENYAQDFIDEIAQIANQIYNLILSTKNWVDSNMRGSMNHDWINSVSRWAANSVGMVSDMPCFHSDPETGSEVNLDLGELEDIKRKLQQSAITIDIGSITQQAIYGGNATVPLWTEWNYATEIASEALSFVTQYPEAIPAGAALAGGAAFLLGGGGMMTNRQ